MDPAPIPFRKWPRAVLFACVAVLCCSVDLLTKEIAYVKLANRTPEIPDDDRVAVVIPGKLEYHYTLNRGVIFGGFQNYGTLFFYVALAAVPVLIAIYARIRRPSIGMSCSLSMILGGTVGNLVDRIRFQAVQDFIFVRDLPILHRDFAIFNVADSCILIGTILLMSELMLFEEKKKRSKGGAPDASAAGPAAGPTGDAPGPAQPG